MRKLSENAIIILGNGFDLAHTLPTSYNDFAEYYCKEVIAKKIISLITASEMPENTEFFNSPFSNYIENLKNPLLYNPNESRDLWLAETKAYQQTEKETPKEIRSLIKSINTFSSSQNDEKLAYTAKTIIDNSFIIKNIIGNTFLGKLYNNEYENWFDIENAYFNELQDFFKQGYLGGVKNLNTEFNEIRDALKKYLYSLTIKSSKEISTFFRNNFIGKENIYVINFNYTNTFSSYEKSFRYGLNDNRDISIEINHIHGTLKEDIVFGYGDDTNQEYQNIKNKDQDEYLENFKTTSYLLNNRYYDIINRIEDFENYEAYIIGHSLGRTDKTLLKEIFDNDKCLNIHLFKQLNKPNSYQKKSFTSLSNNISRVMSNESSLRQKVVSFESIFSFPHPDGSYYNLGYFEDNFKKTYDPDNIKHFNNIIVNRLFKK